MERHQAFVKLPERGGELHQTDALSASVCHPKVPLGPGGRMQPWGQQKPEKLLLQSTSGDH